MVMVQASRSALPQVALTHQVRRATCGAKRLSVVVITWNQCAQTRRCLSTLVPVLDPHQDEIIVIDNGSTDGTDEMIARIYPNVIYRWVPKNLGVGPARNRGLALASGRYLMVLDNDTLVPTTVRLGEIVESTFESHPELGLFGFELLNPDGTRQKSARRFPTLLHPIASRVPGATLLPLFRDLLNEHLMEDTNFDAVSDMLEVDFVLGANQIFRREVLGQTEAYDPAIFYGGEDFEFCYRLRRLGWRVGWSPKLRIVHEHQRITRKFSRTTMRFIVAYLHIFMKYWALWRLPNSELRDG